MKNSSKLFAVLLLTSLAFSGCKKKAGPLSCAADTVRYSEDLSAFIANQTKGNCQSVKNSIEDLVKSCTVLAAVDKASYEEFQNEFDCNDLLLSVASFEPLKSFLGLKFLHKFKHFFNRIGNLNDFPVRLFKETFPYHEV